MALCLFLICIPTVSKASSSLDLKALDDVAFFYPHTVQSKEAITNMIALYLDANEFTLASLLAEKLAKEGPNLTITDHLRMMVAHCRAGEFKKSQESHVVVSDPTYQKSAREKDMVEAAEANCAENRVALRNPPTFQERKSGD